MGDSPDQAAPSKSSEQPLAAFDYIKSSCFRVVHVDGILGGFNSRGLLNIDLWSERPPIPTHAAYVIVDGKGLGEEVLERRVGRESMIREVEVALVMDLELAKAFHGWLATKIGELEQIFANQKKGDK